MTDNHVPYRPGMTLMPGQSTSIEVPIPADASEAIRDGSFSFVEVPPPEKVPVQPLAQSLGLAAGLTAEINHRGGWRCSNCSNYQRDGAAIVWVPDGVSISDSLFAVSDQARREAFNGHGSGWCLSCARKLGNPMRVMAPWVIGILLFVAFFVWAITTR